MKISQQGKVTIPKKLRDQYGFLPGTEVELVSKDDCLFLKKKQVRIGSARTDGTQKR